MDGNQTDVDALANSPLILPDARRSAADMEVPGLVLDRAALQTDCAVDDPKEPKKTI
jgi:hypothetical protein